MSDKLIFIKTNNNICPDTNSYYNVDLNMDLNMDIIYNIIAIIFFLFFILAMKHEKTAKQFILLFKNDLFKILYLSLLLFVDIEKYPFVILMLVCIFFYMIFYIDTKENMENILFLKKNIFQKK